MDRNEQARQQDQLKRANLQHKQNFERFRGDLELGRTGMTDRFGNRVVAGDHILWRPPATHDFVYKVKDVIPVLDPTKPVGVVRLLLVAEIPVEYIAGVPSLSVIRVGVPGDADSATAAAPAPADTSDQGTPAEQQHAAMADERLQSHVAPFPRRSRSDEELAQAHAEGEADAHGQLDRPGGTTDGNG